MPKDSPDTIFTMQKISTKFLWDHSQRMHQMHVWRVKLRFSTGREFFDSDALPPKICVPHPPRWSVSTMVRCHRKKTFRQTDRQTDRQNFSAC